MAVRGPFVAAFRSLLFLTLSLSSGTFSSTQKLYFGIKTYGKKGVALYSAREANAGEQQEMERRSLATNNFLFGAKEDGNDAIIMWKKPIRYGMSGAESVAISTMEFDRNVGAEGTLFGTYQNSHGKHNFGYVQYDGEHATVMDMANPTSHSLEDVRVKIGVSAYLLVDGAVGRYYFGAWNSLEDGDSIWCVRPTFNKTTYALERMPELYSGIHELAEMIVHIAGDTSFNSVALDVVSRPDEGDWECNTVQYEDFELHTRRPDEMYTRKNYTARIFDSLHANPSAGQFSISVNAGLSLFAYDTLKLRSIALGDLSQPFTEPESWEMKVPSSMNLLGLTAATFNQTVFQQSIVAVTDAKNRDDVTVSGVRDVNITVQTKTRRRLLVANTSSTKAGLSVNFSVTLKKTNPQNSIAQLKKLGSNGSDVSKKFAQAFSQAASHATATVASVAVATKNVEKNVVVSEAVIEDACVSSVPGVNPQIPQQLFSPIKQNAQGSPFSDGTLALPALYDVYDDRASIAMELLSSKFDVSIYVKKEVRSESTRTIPLCMCDNSRYDVDCSPGKTVKWDVVLAANRTLAKEDIVTEKIYCAAVNQGLYGTHKPSMENFGTLPQRGCERFSKQLLITGLVPDSFYTVFFIAHAGSQRTRPYTVPLHTKAAAPNKVSLSVSAVRTDGFTIVANYESKQTAPARMFYLIMKEFDISGNAISLKQECDGLTPLQIANLAKDSALTTSLEACDEVIIDKGEVEIPTGVGSTQVEISKSSMQSKGKPQLKKEARFLLYVVAQHNYTAIGAKAFHSTFSARKRFPIHLAEHNISLSSSTLPENNSARVDVYLHLNERPIDTELLNITCYVRGYTSNVQWVPAELPGENENKKWDLNKHVIGQLHGIEDKNSTEVARKAFEIVCRNNVVQLVLNAKPNSVFQDEIQSVAAAESLNVVWPTWSASSILAPPSGAYMYSTRADSISTWGSQVVKLEQSRKDYVGPVYVEGIDVTVDSVNVSSAMVQVNSSGRELYFRAPAYPEVCTTRAKCSGDGGYRPFRISNPWYIGESGALQGARGGYSPVQSIYYYEKCTDTKFSVDPNDCHDRIKSAQKCAFGGGKECVKCPQNSICPGGERAFPHARHWNKNDYSPLVVRCRNPSHQRCVAHNFTGRRVVCGEGYDQASVACESCEKGYYPIWDRSCVKCPLSYTVRSSAVPSLLRAVGYVLILIFGMTMLVYSVVLGIGGTMTSSWDLSKRFLIEMVYFIQLIAMASRPVYPLQDWRATLYSYVLSIFVVDWRHTIPLNCFGNEYSEFTVDFILLVTAFVLSTLSAFLAFFKKARPEEWCRRRSTHRFVRNSVTPYFRFWSLVILAGIYPMTISSVLTVIACEEHGGDSRLGRNLDVMCHTGDHVHAYNLALVVGVVYVIGFPLGASFLLYKNFFGQKRKEFMLRSKLKVYEFWMNDDFIDWRYAARLFHWAFLFVLAVSGFLASYHEHRTLGAAINIGSLVVYLAVVLWYHPNLGKMTLSDRLKQSFWIDSSLMSRLGKSDTPPTEFICPLSRKMFIDPVIAASGVTYEKKMIERWFSSGNVLDPVSKRPLKTLLLKANGRLKQKIIIWKRRTKKKRKSVGEKGKTGWKGINTEETPITEEVYERELSGVQENVMSLHDQPEAEMKFILKFKLHIVLRRSKYTKELKTVRVLLTSEQDPFFHMQEECDVGAFEIIRDQYSLVSTFEDFPQLMGSMFDRSVDEKETFQIVITAADNGLEFAQMSIRKTSMKGASTDIIALNLIPSKYIRKVRWLFVGKLGAILLSIVATTLSYLKYVSFELDDHSLDGSLYWAEIVAPIGLSAYLLLMVVLYLVVSYNFGRRMIIADENRQMIAGGHIEADEAEEEPEDDESMRTELLIRMKLKRVRSAKGPYNLETVELLGELGKHLLAQKGREKDGEKCIKEAMKGLLKNRILPSSPQFMAYQRILLDYETEKSLKASMKKNKFSKPANAAKETIKVTHFVNNSADLWGSWYSSHAKHKSKHRCAIMGQQVRCILICLETVSVVVLTYAAHLTVGESWTLAKSILALIVELVLMVLIDHHVHISSAVMFQRERMIMYDIGTSAVLFGVSCACVTGVASEYSAGSTDVLSADVLAAGAPRSILIVTLQSLASLSTLLLALALFFESAHGLWFCCIKSFKNHRKQKRVRRDTIRRRSIQQHFGQPTFDEEKGETKINMFENPLSSLQATAAMLAKEVEAEEGFVDDPAANQRRRKSKTGKRMTNAEALDAYVKKTSRRSSTRRVEEPKMTENPFREKMLASRKELEGGSVTNPMHRSSTRDRDRRKQRDETTEERAARKAKRRERRSMVAAKETPEERAIRKAKQRSRRSALDASSGDPGRKETAAQRKARRSKRKKQKAQRNSVESALAGLRK